MYFNPLPPYGGRLASDRNDVRSRHFNPLPPYGGRPWIEMPTCTHLSKFQSTPSVWRETCGRQCLVCYLHISIHSLRMEGDAVYLDDPVAIEEFQSTPSVWRETFCSAAYAADRPFQSTPSVWRETYDQAFLTSTVDISIHSLRMEGDLSPDVLYPETLGFQSTPSVWRETVMRVGFGYSAFISIHSLRMEGDTRHALQGRVKLCISIHSLRMEGDPNVETERDTLANFNPLPPYGGRQSAVRRRFRRRDFNPLPPYGGRPGRSGGERQRNGISIHSLRMEGDNVCRCLLPAELHFNPLPPYGGRPQGTDRSIMQREFQSTPSVWRETAVRRASSARTRFQSTPSVWRETNSASSRSPS